MGVAEGSLGVGGMSEVPASLWVLGEKRVFGRLLPVGTRRRRLIGWAVREVRAAVAHSRSEWQRRKRMRRVANNSASVPEKQSRQEQTRPPAGITYKEWFCRLPAARSVLEVQRKWFEQWPRPPKVWVLILEDGGDIAASEISLKDQSWGLIQVVMVKPNGLEKEFQRLVQDCPKDLVVLLGAGDCLRRDALYQIAQAAWRDPWLELLYWDDDLHTLNRVWEWYQADMPEGVYFAGDLERLSKPRIKPSWSPELLLCCNYIGRAFAVRARNLSTDAAQRYASVGAKDDSLWWDILLSLDIKDEQVTRLAAVLQSLSDRADGSDRSIAPHELELVNRKLQSRGWHARADVGGEPGAQFVNLQWPINSDVTVSIIIATRHSRELLEGVFELIRAANYPSLEVIIVDNGGRSHDNEVWYQQRAGDLAPQIIWWDERFNYSAVNNRAAGVATGEVLVFLNDDTAKGHSGWLHNLVGWSQCPEIGVVGLQLIDQDGLIQHGGVIVGMTGLAGHLFQGMAPQSDSLIGHTDWTRNTLAVTGACLAVRREVFAEVGGFEERLELCGSDVVLGLRVRQAGYRNVVSAATPIIHRESATRGSHIPDGDVFGSYWAYQRWLMGGDPYFSPNLDVSQSQPVLHCEEKSSVQKQLSEILERPMEVFYQRNESGEAHALSVVAQAERSLGEAVQHSHQQVIGRQEVKSINWFVPEFQNPFYGGIHTVFRLAHHLTVKHGVENRFVVLTGPHNHDERWYRSGMAAAFGSLANSFISYHDSFAFNPDTIKPADAAVATMWNTAYFAARVVDQTRRFYLIQDFEPMFYPAGTLYALAEHSYRLGLYGLCNTGHLADIYRERYGGVAAHFWPAVDDSIFHAHNRMQSNPERPVTVFIYARPGHLRNCWELAARAVRLVKDELADDVRIVTAGSWAFPEHMDSLITHKGQLDYRDTGPLYRTCDIGVALTTSEHPSYLPLELLACGTAVVAFENPAGDWLLRHDRNCMLAPQTADGLAAEIISLVREPARRQRLAKQGLADIASSYASWEHNLAGVYDYLCNPDSVTGAHNV